jgi:hypothetical protein
MNPFEMVVLIVAIVTVGRVFRAKHGPLKYRQANSVAAPNDAESRQLRDEIKQLKERIAVLERLATDTNSAVALDREIEKLR